jgi:hypothetical protein
MPVHPCVLFGTVGDVRAHWQDLRRQGFTVSQVVHDYGDVCQSITEIAVEQNAHIGTDDFRMLPRPSATGPEREDSSPVFLAFSPPPAPALPAPPALFY